MAPSSAIVKPAWHTSAIFSARKFGICRDGTISGMVPTKYSSGIGNHSIETTVPTITVMIAYGIFLLIIGRISISAMEMQHTTGLMLKYLN